MGLILLGISSVLFLLDVGWKNRVEATPDFKEETPFEEKPIRIRKVHNEGLAFGILKDKPEVVKKVTLLATAIMGIYTAIQWFSKRCLVTKFGSSLIFAGALSNLYDRMTRGYVVDYIGFEVKNEKFRKLTFNIGDFCIFLGCILVWLRSGKRIK